MLQVTGLVAKPLVLPSITSIAPNLKVQGMTLWLLTAPSMVRFANMATLALRAFMNPGMRFPTTNVSLHIDQHSTGLIIVRVLMRWIAVAALGYFNRTLYHWDIATGEKQVTANLTSSGPANATHTNSYVALSTSYIPAFPSPIYPATTSVY
jgi:hypothetical protein